MTAAPCRVLLVDDSDDMLYLARLHLSTPAVDVRLATTGADAIDLHGRERPDVVALDLVLADDDGLDVAASIFEADPTAVIVLFSQFLDGRSLARADALGVRECLSKDHFQQQVVRRHCEAS